MWETVADQQKRTRCGLRLWAGEELLCQEQRFGEAIALFGKYAGFGLPSEFLESDTVVGPRALYACFARKADESDAILGRRLTERFDGEDGLLPTGRQEVFALHTGRSVEEDDQIESLLW